MGILDKLQSKENFNQMPEHLKAMMLFSRWIDYDMEQTGNKTAHYEFRMLPNLIAKELEKMHLNIKNYAPNIKAKDYYSTWFDVGRILNLDSLRCITHDNYEIKKANGGGYEAKEVTNEIN